MELKGVETQHNYNGWIGRIQHNWNGVEDFDAKKIAFGWTMLQNVTIILLWHKN